jgi:hypothetical protein
MDLAELVAMYTEAWAADEAERRRLLEVAWHEDGVYSDPVGRAAGREALVSHIAGFQEQFPGHRIVMTSGVDEHDDGRFRFGWALNDADGNIVMDGVDFGEVADDGRIVRLTGFFDPLPEADPLDRMRRTGVGVEDPNIVGNPGPTGIPPGDEAEGGLLVDDPEGAREAEV